MLKYYVKASDLLERLRTDKDGVVSFEYLIVAFCIVGAVAVAFGTAGGLPGALTAALGRIIAAFATATTTPAA
jgi:pilus assembly protein Flp/PilA